MRCRHCRSDLCKQGGSLPEFSFQQQKESGHFEGPLPKELFDEALQCSWYLWRENMMSHLHLKFIQVVTCPEEARQSRGVSSLPWVLPLLSGQVIILICLLMWYIIFVEVIKLYVWKPLMKYICWDIKCAMFIALHMVYHSMSELTTWNDSYPSSLLLQSIEKITHSAQITQSYQQLLQLFWISSMMSWVRGIFLRTLIIRAGDAFCLPTWASHISKTFSACK